jgi:hypothetical protein
MKIEATKGKSPYAKYQKLPYRYGENYQRWAKAVAETGLLSAQTMAADAAFRMEFGIPARRHFGDFSLEDLT